MAATRREPSKKVIDKHAKFLAAWEAAGFPILYQTPNKSSDGLVITLTTDDS